MCAPPCGTPCASRWPGRRSRRACPAAGGRPWSWSRRRSRFLASHNDPRRAALEAVLDALARAGVASERQTLLLAAGLARRPDRRQIDTFVSPELARRFHGQVAVHDAEADDLVAVGTSGNVELRVNPALAHTDVIVVVSAAETVIHGGPAALVAATSPVALRAAGAYSLLETGASQGWKLGVDLERALAARGPLIGVSLALNHPVLRGALQGYPHDREALDRLVGSWLGRAYSRLPSALRLRIMRGLPVEVSTLGVFAGPPSVAHAEALLRATEARHVRLDEPVDAICIGIPDTTPWLPRERPNPVLAAALGLGYALRLWRERFPVQEGGTAILVHRLHRRYAHPGQQPYRAFFTALRDANGGGALAEAEEAAARDERAAGGVPARRRVPPRAPVRRLAGLQAGDRPPRRGAGRRLAGRHGGADARLRADPWPPRGARDGGRARRRAAAAGRPALAALPAAHGRQLAPAQ